MGTDPPASKCWEHGRHGHGSARNRYSAASNGCTAHGSRYDRCEADVRHTAAVGLGQLAHVDNIVRHTEEIDRPQALNEVLRSLPETR